MEKVTVKAKSPHFYGYVRGYRFDNGVALDVPVKEAKVLVERFGFSYDEPVKPEEETAKPKRSPRKKKGE